MEGVITIRPATVDDCAVIRELEDELAVYQHIPGEFKPTAQELRRDFEEKLWRGMVAEQEGGRVIGFSMYFFVYSWEGKAAHMEDLFVTAAFRGRGIGTRLWKEVLADALANRCKICNFQVMRFNEASQSYYLKKGAKNMSLGPEGYVDFRMEEAAMRALVSPKQQQLG